WRGGGILAGIRLDIVAQLGCALVNTGRGKTVANIDGSAQPGTVRSGGRSPHHLVVPQQGQRCVAGASRVGSTNHQLVQHQVESKIGWKRGGKMVLKHTGKIWWGKWIEIMGHRLGPPQRTRNIRQSPAGQTWHSRKQSLRLVSRERPGKSIRANRREWCTLIVNPGKRFLSPRNLGEPRDAGVPSAPGFGAMGWACVAVLPRNNRAFGSLPLKLHPDR